MLLNFYEASLAQFIPQGGALLYPITLPGYGRIIELKD